MTRPWRTFGSADARTRLLLIAFGACLALMNCSFYLALERLPLSLVAAIEFVGTIGWPSIGLRSGRNLLALALAVAGTFCLIDVRWSSDPVGLGWALLNGVMFVGYVVLGHRLAARGAANGIANLGAAMVVALLFVLPFGFGEAITAFSSPLLLGAAIGVGICSSVIPYICDQLAMSRLPRASFALMLSLLPLSATLIGVDRAGADPWPDRSRRHRAGGDRRRHSQAGAPAIQRSCRGRAYGLTARQTSTTPSVRPLIGSVSGSARAAISRAIRASSRSPGLMMLPCCPGG